jgi:hypothetical protein
VVDGEEIAPVEIPTSDPGVVDTGFGGSGSSGGTGGGSGPGGSTGAGPTEPEENPNDGGDPEPVGPMATCPVAGGAPGTPPSGICFGATVTRIIGNIGDEGNAIRETGGTELYSLPFTPPEPLGGDDYNGKFVVYEWECPDGSKQRSDPCEEPEQEPEPVIWPEGQWNPNEANIWTFLVSDRIASGSGLPGTNNDGSPTSTTVVVTVANEVAWVVQPEIGSVSSEGIPQYLDAPIYKTPPRDMQKNPSPIPFLFALTGGTRSFTLTATVEPSDPDSPDVEDFPLPDDFYARFP